MASVRFRTKNSKREESIYLRFKPGLKGDYEVSTGIKVPKGKFSNALQRINQTDKVDYESLNRKLRDLKIHVRKQFDLDNLEGVIIDNSWLRNTIKTYFNQPLYDKINDSKKYLIQFLDAYTEEEQRRVNKGEINKRTVQYFKSLKKKLQSFEDFKGKKISLTDITISLNQEFVSYLENEQYLSPNTIGRYIKYLRQLCSNAEMKGYSVSKDYKSRLFKAPSGKTYDVYLTTDEIDKIFEYKFENEKLDNVRDWLIVAVWTGLRVSDFLRLDSSFIKEDDYIEITTVKTKSPLLIYINPYIKTILKKREGNFPPVISSQKFNDYVKIVCEKAGINNIVKGAKLVPIDVGKNGKEDIIYRKKTGNFKKYELISSHVGRRSFATNMYGELPTLSIMKITGHTTEKQFLSYIKTSVSEYAEQHKAYWENKS